MREDLEEFVLEMEKVLAKHDKNKGDSWKDCDIKFLENKLKEEFDEWNSLDNRHKKGDETIDIANICMMLWHRYYPEVYKM
jgi:hypothetical protein